MDDVLDGQGPGGDERAENEREARRAAALAAAQTFGEKLQEVANEIGAREGLERLSVRRLEALSHKRLSTFNKAPHTTNGRKPEPPPTYHFTTVYRYLNGTTLAPEDFIDLLAWASNGVPEQEKFQKLRALRQDALAASLSPQHNLENALFRLKNAVGHTEELRKELTASITRIAQFEDTEQAAQRRVQQLRTLLGRADQDQQTRRTLLEELARLDADLKDHRKAYELALERQARLRAELDAARKRAAELTPQQVQDVAKATRHAGEVEVEWLRLDAGTRGLQAQIADLTEQLRAKDQEIARHTGLRARALTALVQIANWLALTAASATGLWIASLWADDFALPQPVGLRVLALLVCSQVQIIGFLLLVAAVILLGALCMAVWSAVLNKGPFNSYRPLAVKVAAGTGLATATALALAGLATAAFWVPSLSLHLGAWISSQAGLPMTAPTGWSALGVFWSDFAAGLLCATLLGMATPFRESRQDDPTVVKGSTNSRRWALGPFFYEESSSFTVRHDPTMTIVAQMQAQERAQQIPPHASRPDSSTP